MHKYTRLLGGLAPIFFSIVNISLCIRLKQKKIKIRGFHKKKFRGFFKMFNYRNSQNVENSIIHKPSLGSLEVPQNFVARSVQPFWLLSDTNGKTPKQTPRQESIYIESIYKFLIKN